MVSQLESSLLYFLLFIPICCNMCNTRANPFINCLDLPINLSVCRREGECRSLCRNGEMPHCHNLRRKVVTEMRVTRPDTSLIEYGASSPPGLVSAPAQVYGTFRLSWSRCSPPVCAGCSKDTRSSISPARSWRGNSGRSQSILQRKLGISQDTCASPGTSLCSVQHTINFYCVLKYVFVCTL